MTSVSLVRRIRARPAIVFDAVTTAEGIAQWWGPDAGPVLVSESDPRVGGRYRLRFRKLVDTGIAIATPGTQLYARIAPRFGLSVKGLDIGAGVVDADYRGSVKVLLIINSPNNFQINQGDRCGSDAMTLLFCVIYVR